MYEDPTFAARRSQAMPTGTNADRYRKVFRIDGSIESQEWSHIVATWFRHNKLAIEYLRGLDTGRSSERSQRQPSRSRGQPHRDKPCPPSMSCGFAWRSWQARLPSQRPTVRSPGGQVNRRTSS
jgi:hypothetical protein